MKNFKLSVLFFSIFFLFLSNTSEAQRIKGSGRVTNQGKTISSFNRIEISSAFTVELIQSEKEFVNIQTDENIQPYVVVEVKNKKLRIRLKKGVNIKKMTTLSAKIGFSHLNEIKLSGATDLKANGILTFDDLKIRTSGASNLELNIKAGQLTVDCSGASDLKLMGQAEIVTLELSGASTLEAYDLHINNCVANVSGASDAEIFASDNLIIEASGASSVHYKGDPKDILVKERSASSVKKR